MAPKKTWRSFIVARTYAQSLQLKNRDAWKAWWKEHDRPADIPSNPDQAYAEDWAGWEDFLGDSYVNVNEEKKKAWRSFIRGRAYAQSLNLRNASAWTAWWKKHDRPNDIPSAPPQAYAGDWAGWKDFLGDSYVDMNMKKAWRSFIVARTYARSLKLKNRDAWVAWWKEHDRPADIPSTPNRAYMYAGDWAGWEDFLGDSYSRTTTKKKTTPPQKKSGKRERRLCAFVIALGLEFGKKCRDWRNYRRYGTLDDLMLSFSHAHATKILRRASLKPSAHLMKRTEHVDTLCEAPAHERDSREKLAKLPAGLRKVMMQQILAAWTLDEHFRERMLQPVLFFLTAHGEDVGFTAYSWRQEARLIDKLVDELKALGVEEPGRLIEEDIEEHEHDMQHFVHAKERWSDLMGNMKNKRRLTRRSTVEKKQNAAAAFALAGAKKTEEFPSTNAQEDGAGAAAAALKNPSSKWTALRRLVRTQPLEGAAAGGGHGSGHGGEAGDTRESRSSSAESQRGSFSASDVSAKEQELLMEAVMRQRQRLHTVLCVWFVKLKARVARANNSHEMVMARLAHGRREALLRLGTTVKDFYTGARRKRSRSRGRGRSRAESKEMERYDTRTGRVFRGGRDADQDADQEGAGSGPEPER